jgi:hypothetical protein
MFQKYAESPYEEIGVPKFQASVGMILFSGLCGLKILLPMMDVFLPSLLSEINLQRVDVRKFFASAAMVFFSGLFVLKSVAEWSDVFFHPGSLKILKEVRIVLKGSRKSLRTRRCSENSESEQLWFSSLAFTDPKTLENVPCLLFCLVSKNATIS